jgi:hypothetical protein
MAYFADLTPYTYLQGVVEEGAFNIGWLDVHHPFPQGGVSSEVLAKVFALCKSPAHHTRGFHTCPWCLHGKNVLGIPIERDGVRLTLGHAEIRVICCLGIQYACPDMVYHYIKDHSYLPPQEFIDCVLQMP